MTRPSSRYPRAVISPCDVPAFLPQASPTNLEMDVWMEEAVRAKHIAKTGAISERFCTNCLCQEYPIEEADDTAGNTGSRHQKGAGNQRIF